VRSQATPCLHRRGIIIMSHDHSCQQLLLLLFSFHLLNLRLELSNQLSATHGCSSHHFSVECHLWTWVWGLGDTGGLKIGGFRVISVRLYVYFRDSLGYPRGSLGWENCVKKEAGIMINVFRLFTTLGRNVLNTMYILFLLSDTHSTIRWQYHTLCIYSSFRYIHI